MENTIKSFLKYILENYEHLNQNEKKQISEFYMQFRFVDKNKENEFGRKIERKSLQLKTIS